MPDSREQFFGKWRDTFKSGDWDAHCALYADDVRWTFPPGSMVLESNEATRGALEGFTTRYSDIQLELGRLCSDGPLTAVEWTESGTETDSGEAVGFQFCGMLEFEDDQISRVARYGGK